MSGEIAEKLADAKETESKEKPYLLLKSTFSKGGQFFLNNFLSIFSPFQAILSTFFKKI